MARGGTVARRRKGVRTGVGRRGRPAAGEKYFALTLDRKTAGPVAIACSEGGTSIEDLAHDFPDRIVRVPINPLAGMTDADAEAIVNGLRVTADRKDALAQVKAMYKVFTDCDVTLLEVNPPRRLSAPLQPPQHAAADANLENAAL